MARGQLVLSPEELIDALPKTHDLNDREMVAALKEGADVAVEEGWLATEQRQRYLRVLVGEEDPRPQLTAEELFQAARILKGSADRTVAGWRKAMSDFLGFAAVAHPTAATREHAVAYRSHLLQRVKSSTAKTNLAYLAGLWSVLNENHPGHPNVFHGPTRRIKVVKARKVEVHIENPDIWEGS